MADGNVEYIELSAWNKVKADMGFMTNNNDSSSTGTSWISSMMSKLELCF